MVASSRRGRPFLEERGHPVQGPSVRERAAERGRRRERGRVGEVPRVDERPEERGRGEIGDAEALADEVAARLQLRFHAVERGEDLPACDLGRRRGHIEPPAKESPHDGIAEP
jgi:hypothetical protein